MGCLKFETARTRSQPDVLYIVIERGVQMPPISILVNTSLGELCVAQKICLYLVIYGDILWSKAETGRES